MDTLVDVDHEQEVWNWVVNPRFPEEIVEVVTQTADLWRAENPTVLDVGREGCQRGRPW